MNSNLPIYIPIVFIFTTFLSLGILLRAIRFSVYDNFWAKAAVFLTMFWLFFQGVLGVFGFYLGSSPVSPKLLFFGVLPAVAFVIFLLIFARKNFIEPLPLRALTLLSVVRIPVEIVIFWLFQNGFMPEIMTFSGWNFDIVAGISAVLIAWLAFRNNRINRNLLIIWHFLAAGLLVVGLNIAVLSLSSPLQKFAFEQPNTAVLYFPFVWLPTIVVPIILFSHLASLLILLKNKAPRPES